MNIFASGLFTALNNGKISAVISVARTLVFECAAMLILPMFIGINGVWSALPVAELCAVAISVTFIIANAKIPSGRCTTAPRSCRQFVISKTYQARV